MPRPAVLDDVRRAEVLALASHGFSRQAIADFADCDLKIIEQAAQRDPAFGQQLRLARSKFVCRNIEIIQRHAAQSPKHSTWLLERLDPEKFARRSPYSITPAQLVRHFQTWLTPTALIADNSKLLQVHDLQGQFFGALLERTLPRIFRKECP